MKGNTIFLKTTMKGCYTSNIMLLFCSFLFPILIISTPSDTISATQSIRDGDTLVSSKGIFVLGFFSPADSEERFVGVWYKISNSTVVWVANRDTPLLDSSGVLAVTNQGNLIILNQNKTIIWSSNSSRLVNSPVAQILDSGNLVVRDGGDNNPENFLWQSFDYPRDTLLPGGKWGIDLETGLDRYLSSWKSSTDPAEGEYTFKVDPYGLPQSYIRKGSVIQFRSGPWNGLRFSGRPNLKPNPVYKFSFIYNEKEIYFAFEPYNSSVLMRTTVTLEGHMQRFLWNDRSHDWILYLAAQTDRCDTYALCGVYGSCNIDNSPICECLKGFVPKFQRDWDMADWSNGCVRRTPLNCQKGDGFVKYASVKVPDTHHSWYNKSMNIEECEMMCLKNCTCTAYTSLNISTPGGSGCLLWFDELIDIREYTVDGQDIFIRMASSEISRIGSNEQKRKRIIASLVSLTALLFVLGLTLYARRRKKNNSNKKMLNREAEMGNNSKGGCDTESRKEDLELPLFDLATLAYATDYFSLDNKLGEGGFGPVYKGVFEGGREIAVKRLSQNSKQGVDEFKNEVLCIAKLQHRNLVKLLGCCIEEENMLIYEYLPNKSLDLFIFDEKKSMVLNWHKRFQIIHGIARGLLYLHQDSRLRIIHRDLKASNILLDYDMNPKISDFGLARSFGGNETGANTARVVGTYGYMSPEYAIDGIFSVKSDVFSFGVLVLEIVSGEKNRGFQHAEHHLNLLGHAWKLYLEGRSLQLIATSVSKSCNVAEVLRAIHIALLCVQQSPEDRPSMSNVVVMMESENALPEPKQPGFFTERNLPKGDSSSSRHNSCSVNEMTVTLLSAR